MSSTTPLNNEQLLVAKHYACGANAHLSTMEEVDECGDTLFMFFIREAEECGSMEGLHQALDIAKRDVEELINALSLEVVS